MFFFFCFKPNSGKFRHEWVRINYLKLISSQPLLPKMALDASEHRRFMWRRLFSATGFLVGLSIAICFTTAFQNPSTAIMGGISGLFAAMVFSGKSKYCTSESNDLSLKSISLNVCKLPPAWSISSHNLVAPIISMFIQSIRIDIIARKII